MLRGKLIVFFVVIVRAVLVSPRHDDAGCPRCCAVIVSRDVSTPLNQFARCPDLPASPRTSDRGLAISLRALVALGAEAL